MTPAVISLQNLPYPTILGPHHEMLYRMSSGGAQTKKRVTIFGTRARFFLLVLVLICLTSIWSNILVVQIAVVCMAPIENGTEEENYDHYDINNSQVSLSISVAAAAALLFNVPVVGAVNRLGIRTVFATLGLISGIATLFMPAAIKLGFYWLLVCRFFQGVGFAANFPVIGAFCAKWTYYKQTGMFVSFLVAYVQLAPAVTDLVSGPLCSISWEAIFYAHGSLSIGLFLSYLAMYRNSPARHPFVGDVELSKISRNKAALDKKGTRIPYGAILLTPAVWAVWSGAIGNFFAVNLLFLYSPAYFSKTLHMDTKHSALNSAMPALLEFFIKLACGAISDRIRCVSEVNKFRVFNSVAFFGGAICFVALAFTGAEDTTLNVVLLTAAAAILGVTTGGFFKAAPVLSKQYSHFVTGNISLLLTLTMLIVPIVVSNLVRHDTLEEWRVVFLITAAVLICTNIVFVYFVRGEACSWTAEPPVRGHSVAPATIALPPTVSSAPTPIPFSLTSVYNNENLSQTPSAQSMC